MAKTSSKTSARPPSGRSRTTSAKRVTASAKPKSAVSSGSTETMNAQIVETMQPVVSGPEMRKRELIDSVVKLSGIKKKSAKPVVEAMLSVLGSALQEGRELNLQPMGKVKINREKKRSSGKVLIARIRQSKDLSQSEVTDVVVETKPVPDAAE